MLQGVWAVPQVHSRDYWSALQQFLAQYVDPR